MLIDTHAHLYWEDFKKDFDQVLQRSKEAGVTTIINVGVDIEKSQIALKLAEGSLSEYSMNKVEGLQMYSTIGIHPHEAVKYIGVKGEGESVKLQQDIEKLEEIYKESPQKVIGVGECGLDFLFDNNPDYNPSSLSKEELKDLQRKLFKAQIDLAKKLGLPLIVHCRDDRSKNPSNVEAWDEVLELTKDHFGIYHCYSGLPHNTNYIIHNTKFLISFAANITYPKNEYLREAVKNMPLEKICLETDCPFLSPQSKRGQRNEPSAVLEIAQLISEIKNTPFSQVSNQTTLNVKMLFKLT